MTRPVPGKELLDAFRKHRSQLHSWQTMYPYAMGRVEEALKATHVPPAQRIIGALLQIAALDIVMAEPLPDPEPMQCPECGMGRPGHTGGCSLGPVATLGPRS